MSEEKNGSYKGLTEARRRANKKYNDRFVEIKVRVTPEKRAIIKDHAEKMGESATAFINRAIDEAMKRDQDQIPKRKTSGDVWIHFHTSPDDFFSHELSPLCNFLYEYICNKAPHLHVFFVIFYTFQMV